MGKVIIFILILCAGLNNSSYAGFLVRKQLPSAIGNTSAVLPGQQEGAAGVNLPGKVLLRGKPESSLKSLLAGKLPRIAEMPKGVYIALAILPIIGCLAIAINTGFTESEWIFAMLLYFVFYIPGVIYTLSMMKRFYS